MSPTDRDQLISEVAALIDAVVAGELLAALPALEVDRERHRAAVGLIELAHARLRQAGALASLPSG